MPTLNDRASGVLLHTTSLPGSSGNGDLDAAALGFADFLTKAKPRFWQMLPVAPPSCGSSPYSARSAFARNPMLISLDTLVEEGLLRPGEREAATRYLASDGREIRWDMTRMALLPVAGLAMIPATNLLGARLGGEDEPAGHLRRELVMVPPGGRAHRRDRRAPRALDANVWPHASG